jgi:hypothetical protein
MTPEEIAQWAALAGQVGGNTLLVLAIVGLIRGWVVTRQHHEEVCQEKDERIEYLERKLNGPR